MELIVVNADFAIRVLGGDCELKVGGEKSRVGGDVEGVEGGVLEDETGIFGGMNKATDEGAECDEWGVGYIEE
ncbi:hypothetical protein AgCh_036457 [Apium graveolens]